MIKVFVVTVLHVTFALFLLRQLSVLHSVLQPLGSKIKRDSIKNVIYLTLINKSLFCPFSALFSVCLVLGFLRISLAPFAMNFRSYAHRF